MLEGRGQRLVSSIWKEDSSFVLDGGPTRRLIEFREKLDRAHQDAIDDGNDFPYALMRFGHLLYYGANSGSVEAYAQLRRETDRLPNLMRNTRTDRYSASHPNNLAAWKETSSMGFYYGAFVRISQTKETRGRREIPKTYARISLMYFATGRLRAGIPDWLRNSMLVYWGPTFLLNGSPFWSSPDGAKGFGQNSAHR